MNGRLQGRILIDQFFFPRFMQQILNLQMRRILGYRAQAAAPQMRRFHDALDHGPLAARPYQRRISAVSQEQRQPV